MKPYRIKIDDGWDGLWINAYVLSSSEDEAVKKYNNLKKGLFMDKATEACCSFQGMGFSELKNWNKVKHLVKNKDGIFTWPSLK